MMNNLSTTYSGLSPYLSTARPDCLLKTRLEQIDDIINEGFDYSKLTTLVGLLGPINDKELESETPIRQVVELALLNRNFPVILWVLGGYEAISTENKCEIFRALQPISSDSSFECVDLKNRINGFILDIIQRPIDASRIDELVLLLNCAANCSVYQLSELQTREIQNMNSFSEEDFEMGSFSLEDFETPIRIAMKVASEKNFPRVVEWLLNSYESVSEECRKDILSSIEGAFFYAVHFHNQEIISMLLEFPHENPRIYKGEVLFRIGCLTGNRSFIDRGILEGWTDFQELLNGVLETINAGHLEIAKFLYEKVALTNPLLAKKFLGESLTRPCEDGHFHHLEWCLLELDLSTLDFKLVLARIAEYGDVKTMKWFFEKIDAMLVANPQLKEQVTRSIESAIFYLGRWASSEKKVLLDEAFEILFNELYKLNQSKAYDIALSSLDSPYRYEIKNALCVWLFTSADHQMGQYPISNKAIQDRCKKAIKDNSQSNFNFFLAQKRGITESFLVEVRALGERYDRSWVRDSLERGFV